MATEQPVAQLQPVTVTGHRLRPPPKDDVSIIIDGRALSGWLDVRITRGIERCPGDFTLSYTENTADFVGPAVQINPGDACEVKIGNDLVLTGYIDRIIPSVDVTSHKIIAIGRGRCQDLVDCASNYKGGIISGKIEDIATVLAFPYEIGIETYGDFSKIKAIPDFNVSHGQTPFEVISTLCKFKQLLCYEQPNGNLLLTREFPLTAASGFQQGVNIKKMSAEFSMDQRYSDYWVYNFGLDMFNDLGPGGNLVGSAKDPGVGRFRLRKIINDASGSFAGQDFANDCAAWEGTRRLGRSAIVRLTADNWRDKNGTLFVPGMMVNITAPAIYMTSEGIGSNFVIGELTYRKDATGTNLDVTAMSPAAFNPQPILIAKGVSRAVMALPNPSPGPQGQ